MRHHATLQETRAEDWRGLPLTRAGHTTRAALDDFSQGLLGYQPRVLRVLAAADADPDCPLAQACAAMLRMFSESRTGPAEARPYIERAEAGARHATPRERLVIGATRAWIDGDVMQAIAIGEQIAREHPRDLAMAKVTQYHMFNLGDFAGLLRVGLQVLPANAEIAAVHGMVAFGWEECHRLADAENEARAALDLDPAEPWAQHALAHVLLTRGENDAARDFLDRCKHGWMRLTSFMHTHNWWHLALVQIEQDDAAAVLDDFDTHIWGICKTYTQDQIGAVSLLARLELAGIDVGERWQDLADHLAARLDDHVQPFLSLHYVYGLARAGCEKADAMLDAIRRTAAHAPAATRRAWTEVAVPVCDGLVAHARADWSGAVTRLRPVMPRLSEIGGSHAQRDLIDQVLVDSLMRTGQWGAAQQALEMRLAGNPHSAPTLRRRAQTYRALGLPAPSQ